MLADRDTGWIADKYLEIPSELWPPSSLDEHYTSARDRWLARKQTPENYADFLDIKRGLRTATFEYDAKRDLGEWIEAMRSFIAEGVSERLIQKARYEISVAELRGRGSLDPAMPLVETFLATATSDRPAAELLDAAVLTVYAWGSNYHGESSASPEQLKEWLRRNDALLAEALAATPSRGRPLSATGSASAHGLSSTRHQTLGPNDGPNRFFDRWQAVVDVVRETPLFPINHVADIFETAAILLEPNDRLSFPHQPGRCTDRRAGRKGSSGRSGASSRRELSGSTSAYRCYRRTSSHES